MSEYQKDQNRLAELIQSPAGVRIQKRLDDRSARLRYRADCIGHANYPNVRDPIVDKEIMQQALDMGRVSPLEEQAETGPTMTVQAAQMLELDMQRRRRRMMRRYLGLIDSQQAGVN